MTSEIHINAVGLFSFNFDTGKWDRLATVRPDKDGKTLFEGNPNLVKRLQEEAVVVDDQTFLPEDGQEYFLALIKRYTDPYLKAMPLET